ncbi:hypothetical protein AVEN_148121-1 [Araneus ventricosus]|uniref:Uncharacterized protein n=1 Tax=Araneus ventricosus TaxID=182803 RepID=A0A4Y2SNX6_ARAVE|nr:hypothetical protein AVEN_148121-1 [Araneus ventricosus]
MLCAIERHSPNEYIATGSMLPPNVTTGASFIGVLQTIYGFWFYATSKHRDPNSTNVSPLPPFQSFPCLFGNSPANMLQSLDQTILNPIKLFRLKPQLKRN